MVRLLGMIFLMGLSGIGGYFLSPHAGKIDWPSVADRYMPAEKQSQPRQPQPCSSLQKGGVTREMVALTNIFLGTDVSGDFATLEDLCQAVNGGGGGRESCARLH